MPISMLKEMYLHWRIKKCALRLVKPCFHSVGEIPSIWIYCRQTIHLFVVSKSTTTFDCAFFNPLLSFCRPQKHWRAHEHYITTQRPSQYPSPAHRAFKQNLSDLCLTLYLHGQTLRPGWGICPRFVNIGVISSMRTRLYGGRKPLKNALWGGFEWYFFDPGLIFLQSRADQAWYAGLKG